MNEVLRTIESLRSIHGDFSEKAVSAGDLSQILGHMTRAATASGRQSYSVVVIRDRPVMHRLFGYQGSVALLFCADHNRMVDLADRLGYVFDPRTLQDYVTAHSDTVLAAQTAVIAAKSLGIDSLITNAPHRKDPDLFYDVLDLPEKFCVPVMAVILGYPLKEPDHRRGRLNGKGVVHPGKYRSLSEDELDRMIDLYDTEDPRYGMIGNWKEKGFRHYLDYLFGAWFSYPRKSTKGSQPDRGHIDSYLERAGFR